MIEDQPQIRPQATIPPPRTSLEYLRQIRTAVVWIAVLLAAALVAGGVVGIVAAHHAQQQTNCIAGLTC